MLLCMCLIWRRKRPIPVACVVWQGVSFPHCKTPKSSIRESGHFAGSSVRVDCHMESMSEARRLTTETVKGPTLTLRQQLASCANHRKETLLALRA